MSEQPETKPVRRRRSRKRRAVLLLALSLLLAAVAAYRHYTRPERLRAYAEHWLSQFTGGEARVESAHFNPLKGLSLAGVSLALPASERFDPADDSFAARTFLRSSMVFFRFKLLSLLKGELSVPEIVVIDPALTYVQRASDGVDNWQTMLRHRSALPSSATPTNLPILRFRNARLIQHRLTERGRDEARTLKLSAEAQPLSGEPDVYDIRLSLAADAAAPRTAQSDTGRLRINMRTLDVNAHRLPAIRVNELLFATTPEIQRWIDLLDLEGSIAPERVELNSRGRKMTLSLSDARLSIPIDPAEESLESTARYLRFDDIGGAIRFEGSAADVDLHASFHGSPVRLAGSMHIDATGGGGLDAIGFEITLEARDVQLPRDEPERNAAESRFVRRWKNLRNFVRDFDGIGLADFSLQLRKEPGPGANLRFVDGEMRPKGVSAQYIHFPYRITNMSGAVHFRPDGTETIDLKGLHGHSVITFSGWEGGYKTQAGDLTIRGYDVALDDDLRRCLKPQDQRLCERFGLQARMNLDIRLKRTDAPPGTPDNPWKPEIDVTFREGMVRFESFPYPLEGLRGQMRIADGAFEITGLTARHGEAVVRAGGTARWAGRERPDVDLQIEASGVPFDSALLGALPGTAKDHYRELNPSGRFDLSGRIRSGARDEAIDYDLVVQVDNAQVDLPTSARLTHVSAGLRIVPSRITVESAGASLGRSRLSGKGWVSAGPGPRSFCVHVTSDRLSLDDDLRQALTPGLRHVYESFQPAGAARVELSCERPPADTGDAAALQYSLRVEPLGASATYDDFPLPLEDVRGSFTATPRGVEIHSLEARSSGASIALSGRVEPAGDRSRARLTARARRLRFDEPLRTAMPRRIRRQWDALKPQGEFDADFHELEFISGGDSLAWRFAGRLDLRDVSMDLGTRIADASGSISGSCEISDTLALDAEFALDRVRIDDRLLSEALARVKRTADDPVMHIELTRGRFYEGSVSANGRIDYGLVNPTFSIDLDTRGVSLGQFMNADRKPDKPAVAAHGIVDAHLTLNGRFGDPPSRKGSGRVAIREAQMVKIPWMLSILQVLNLTLDDNAFHDALFGFTVDGEELLLYEIDLRGRAMSMVGAGVVNTITETLDLTLLAGGPIKLPYVAVLSDLLEGVAREVMEVRVEGTLERPTFRAEVARSLRRTVEALLSLRRRSGLGG